MNIWDEGKRRPKGRFLSASEGFLVIPRLFPSFSAASREEDSSMDPTTTKTLHSCYVYLFLSHVLNSSSWQKLPEAFSSLSLTIDICPVLTSNEEKSSWSPHRDETTSIESFWPRLRKSRSYKWLFPGILAFTCSFGRKVALLISCICWALLSLLRFVVIAEIVCILVLRLKCSQLFTCKIDFESRS